MKKIMFSERYGLEQAVLAGTKTMTRRLMTMTLHKKNGEKMEPVVPDNMFIKDGVAYFCLGNLAHKVPKENQPAYNVGDELAIAQAYQTLRWPALPGIDWKAITDKVTHSKGWTNKMFVKAEYMPHRIHITGIKAERLQDVSDEEAMREGIRQSVVEYGDKKIVQWTYFGEKITTWFDSPREAFSALIDRISGRGTWQRNPWVYAYTFELIK